MKKGKLWLEKYSDGIGYYYDLVDGGGIVYGRWYDWELPSKKELVQLYGCEIVGEGVLTNKRKEVKGWIEEKLMRG